MSGLPEDIKWLPISSAPKDGTIILLLVEFYEHSTDDKDVAVTIGSNFFDNNEQDEWEIAGWSWTQDVFCKGHGTPIGWWPILTPKIP